MAVSNLFRSLIFGDVNSADYGIYISGDAVYNAPKRAVEMVSVPGRNGSIAMDQGHWENIEIEYPAGTYGDSQADFATAISEFRNAICSQLGYQRLTDTYHPEEYRMAIYMEGLEVEPVQQSKAGEFTIKFNCKPQRWLTDGEEAVSVASGDTLTNPTPYESNPLLMVEGYGNIALNGHSVDIENVVMGEVTLNPSSSYYINYSNSLFEDGDSITLGKSTVVLVVTPRPSNVTVVHVSVGTRASSDFNRDSYTNKELSNGAMRVYITLPELEFTAGTTETKYSYVTSSITYSVSGNQNTATVDYDIRVRHVKNVNQSQISISIQNISYSGTTFRIQEGTGEIAEAVLDSTKSILGHPTYVDCDLGEAYKLEDGEVIGLNAYIDLGSDLPSLAKGSNEITYDNTVTSLEVVPRWWKL